MHYVHHRTANTWRSTEVEDGVISRWKYVSHDISSLADGAKYTSIQLKPVTNVQT